MKYNLRGDDPVLIKMVKLSSWDKARNSQFWGGISRRWHFGSSRKKRCILEVGIVVQNNWSILVVVSRTIFFISYTNLNIESPHLNF